ncbi:HPP family protein [Rudanella paleaurantiibacter]|uniref:HPP family protein n=1 Tax=Rudanella paleaurantiibacter TaxID=2614655 RepID=A0A7J5TUS7_9BACT|nr:HPP family protein [Rudanella paleaurantiibacter]KAB7727894.1 HPP family protein [Rudanella paleaurantiibacter]
MKRHYRVARYVIYRQTLLRPADHFWTFLGAFVAIAAIGLMQQTHFTEQDNVFLIGSLGASCVLIFGSAHSPLAQPRNLVGGHLIASLIGVAVYKLFPGQLWLSSALAVSLSIVAMQITKTMHPPGGATALIANIGSEKIKSLGFAYTFSPVLTGVGILLLTALLINNIPADRSYPADPLSWRKLRLRARKHLRQTVK